MIFCCLNGGLFSIKSVLSSSWHFMSNATVTNVISNNPCISCGACCAHFRVSFYWAESEAKGLAVELTEQINSFFSCMKGTNQAAPRCDALAGEIGGQVACTVYEQRPEACKEVQSGDEKCNINLYWSYIKAPTPKNARRVYTCFSVIMLHATNQ